MQSFFLVCIFSKRNMPIYTRTGDKGKTSLLGGKRVLKSDDRVDTYGTVDELNSVLGVVVSQLSKNHNELKKELESIQHDLFAVGSYLSHPHGEPLSYLGERVSDFEKKIDEMTEKLPELKNFILPGGSSAGAALHQARTVSRRVERRLVALMQHEDIDESIVKYVNRLSDLLFTMARDINFKEKQKETIWAKKA